MTKLEDLSSHDRREIKHYKIFLKLSNKYGIKELVKRRFWQKYCGLVKPQHAKEKSDKS